MSEAQPVPESSPFVLIVGAGLGGLMLGTILESANIPCGYDCLLVSRPKLHDLLRRRVPDHKISMGKRVLRQEEHDDKVTVYCSDDTTYECSVIVGADGAYSAVRQNIYRQLDEEDKLPLSDKAPFTIGYTTMVGTASHLNPERYPELKDKRGHFRLISGNKNDSSYAVTVPDNKICWALQIQASESKSEDENLDWGQESVETMIKEFEEFPCAYGGTMKDLFDATPKKLISKIFLEEKVFRTWYHGRSVLIGDACHKLLPGGGQGAGMAFRDAVVLANCLYNMKDNSSKSIKSAFDSYYRQRYPEAEMQLKNSAYLSKVMFGQRKKKRATSYSGRKLIGYHL
ncbi:hypothetical protein BGZ80_002177 [Entomortierella chlamydospora]|uniref:FAD-binding domain-containing protein n=1 Tax=Entomortierella chlamydospora TaxID=101097 RepID=A0A9P6N1C1_9FUNG|nr:hypothetical protein BGZ80_002177 [Entomortierella chlamydospora]